MTLQVSDEGNFTERSLYYWAREFSTALVEGKDYIQLPRTVVISILGFKVFDCEEYHSEFQALEVTRHTPLTNRLSLHYFELPKLPKVESAEDKLKLWLALFKAETEEDLAKIKSMGVPVMEQAIEAYQNITESERMRQIQRARDFYRVDEMYRLYNAHEKGKKEADEKWQSVVAEKDAEIARLRSQLDNQQI